MGYKKVSALRTRIRRAVISFQERCALSMAFVKLRYLHAKNRKSVVLIGTPTHGNLGDQAIVLAERDMLQGLGYGHDIVEICSSNYLRHADRIQAAVSPEDVLIIDGGGSMGTLWVHNEYRFRDVVSRFPENTILIFPQTIYYGKEDWEQEVLRESIPVYQGHPDLTVSCRDMDSFEFAKKHRLSGRILYTPDVVLSFYPQGYGLEREQKALLCYRDDIEADLDMGLKDEIEGIIRELPLEIGITSTLTGGYINSLNRKKEVRRKWEEFAGVQLVVTDRLHAMIFCALTGTPCIALDNLSRKVSGQYAWISGLPYIVLIRDRKDIRNLDMDVLLSNAGRFEELGLLKESFMELGDMVLR